MFHITSTKGGVNMKKANKEETMKILEQFFGECLKYWERTLNVDSDLSNEAYKQAIKEIPTCNPYKVIKEELNPEWVQEFKKYRLMDCYGKDWEKYQ